MIRYPSVRTLIVTRRCWTVRHSPLLRSRSRPPRQISQGTFLWQTRRVPMTAGLSRSQQPPTRPNLPQANQIHQRGVIPRNPTPIPTPVVPIPQTPPPEDEEEE